MTNQFLTPLRVEKIGPQRWLLTDDLVFYSERFRGTFVAPRGFQTDFASVPRWLWSWLPPVDVWDAAAVIHDAGYSHALLTSTDVETAERIHLIKKYTDLVFLDGLNVLGVPKWKRGMMYWMVSKFGDQKQHPLSEHVKGAELFALG